MIVYIEYVFIDNFVIDFLILKTTFIIMGIKCNRIRLILISALGGCFALIFPLINISPFFSTLIKILFGVLMLLFSNKYKSAKSFYYTLLVFLSITFLLGGAIIGIYTIFNIDYFSETSIAVMVLPSYILIRVIKEIILYIYKRKEVVSLYYDIEITCNKKEERFVGFLDTGNQLYYENSPVIIVRKSLAKKLYFSNGNLLKGKFIKVNTINKSEEKFIFNLSTIKIYIDNAPNIFNNVIACVGENLPVNADIILHPALLRREDESIKTIKKIS